MSNRTGHPAEADAVPGDRQMTRVLWPFMLASAVGLVPFTVYSTFLVPIADTADGSVAALGQLRGLGGLAALAVGTALALPAALGATGEFLLLTVFCLLVGGGPQRRRGRRSTGSRRSSPRTAPGSCRPRWTARSRAGCCAASGIPSWRTAAS